MANIKYLLIVEDAVEIAENKANFMGVFDMVTIPREQSQVTISFCVVGRIINLPPVSGTLLVRLYKPDGELFSEAVLEGTIDATGIINIIARFNLINFSDRGIYPVRLDFNGTPVEGYDLSLEVR